MYLPIFRLKLLFAAILTITMLISACNNHNPQTQISSSQKSTENTTSDGDKLKNAPDFTLTDMEGETFRLSDHEGKVVVLNIWATWCPPCRKEVPDFIEIQKEMRDEGVLFVGVSQDEEGWEVVRPFAEKYHINYPLVVDDGTVREKYGPFRGLPTTFIINKKGKVEYVAPGLVSRSMLEPVLVELAAR